MLFSSQCDLHQLKILKKLLLFQVALLHQIGKEAIPPDIVPQILASRDRRELAKYALAAPPHGLCLVAVKYDQEHLRLPTGCLETSFGRHRTITYCKLPYY